MDVYDAQTRSRVMRAVPAKDTSPEMRVRRLLHRSGFRYRLHSKGLPGTPDLVFPGRRKVIFVHGCFWHQHPGCPRSVRPSSNTEYWRKKLDRNIERDKETTHKLGEAGWQALVLWECELKDETALLQRLSLFLGGRGGGAKQKKQAGTIPALRATCG
jgi:DNA mismatch endonuclease (patch repair protein)